MGQILFPFFPSETRMITAYLGVKEDEGMVYYFHNGMPIYSHEKEDHNRFRYCTSNFLVQGMCKNVDIVRVFHVSTDSVRRWKKKLSEHGEAAFFSGSKSVRRSHIMTPSVLERIQHELDKGRSVNSIAKQLSVSEGTIRYSIGKGRLKKNSSRR